jgi:hypothetical protein
VSAAWPFLLGRSKNAGHRIVVAPGYLADGGQPWEIERLARGESSPGEAFIAEVPHGPGGEPATAIFRVFRATEADFLGPGDNPLTDRGGREIRITEGIVLPLPRARAERLGLTTADLEAFHLLLAPSFREFWQQEDSYRTTFSRPVSVGGQADRGPALTLRPLGFGPAAPPSSPPLAGGDARTAWPPRPARPAPGPTAAGGAAAGGFPPASPGGPASRGRPVALAIGAAIITFAVVVGAYEVLASRPGSGSGPPGRDMKTTLADMCSALDNGNLALAYSLTTPGFRARTSQAAFSAELTAGTGKARSCDPALAAGSATGTVTITTDSGGARSWTVGLTSNGSSWEISSLRSRPR